MREASRVRDPLERDERIARLEAVLFISREPLSTRKLAQLAGLADGTEARTCVGRLNQIYEATLSAFRVESVAGGFQLLTRPRYSPWLRRLHQSRVETRLSSPAAETLAIIAYRQPVVRAEIEAIRGVKCGEIVRQLMERDLVRIAGKSEELGRPFLYATTRRFLQVFGLRDLDELPRAEKLRASPGAADPAGTSAPLSEPSKDVSPHEEESEVKASVKIGLAEQLEWDQIEGRTLRSETVRAAKKPSDDEDEDEEDVDDEEDEDDEEDDEDEEDLEEEEWEEVDDEDEEEEDEEEEEDDDEDEDWDEEWDEEEEEEEDEDDEEEWDDEDDEDDDEEEEEEEDDE